MFTYGNYAGDVMNFGLASERLRRRGIDVRNVIVTDDIASAAAAEAAKAPRHRRRLRRLQGRGRRGRGGLDIDEVERLGRTPTSGPTPSAVAFSGCTFPGAEEPLFSVPDGPDGARAGDPRRAGRRRGRAAAADELAQLLVSPAAGRDARPGRATGSAVILNGLGSTKYEELFVLWIPPRAAAARAAGLTIVVPEVGELVTSLDMAGVSLTLTWLDDELEPLWTRPADPGLPSRRRRRAPARDDGRRRRDVARRRDPFAAARPRLAGAAAVRCRPDGRPQRAIHDAEEARPASTRSPATATTAAAWSAASTAARAAAAEAVDPGAGAGAILVAAGDAWADKPAARPACCGAPACGRSASPSATSGAPSAPDSLPR